ncbi:MAG: group II intron reverse transcriptase/maturase [Shewanella sp.]|nr:group II intron reverse transcriptase/maturase [Shewanella sp.]
MEQQELFKVDSTELFETLCRPITLGQGFRMVSKNGGSAGIDGITIKDYKANLEQEIQNLSAELINWTYEPKPVRRVEIPKPGGGVRLLGVPCVRDRVVQATIKYLLEPIIDPTFSENSYGFRPGRSQKQAIEKAQSIVNSGKDFVVDIDLSKFFDRVMHDRIINKLKYKYNIDKRILRLIGLTLRCGVMVDGRKQNTYVGTTQGSPLSPLLSNVILDELDKELESRGLEFCRFADDCNIFVKSKKAADRVMASISGYIEKRLKLVVNKEKSKTGKAECIKFLGITIIGGLITISSMAMNRANEKLQELIPRGTHNTIYNVVTKLNTWYRGWSGYYGMTEDPKQLQKIEAHARRRLRAKIVYDHKRPNNLRRTLMRRGASSYSANKIINNMGIWATSKTYAMHKAYPNRYFIKDLGQYVY